MKCTFDESGTRATLEGSITEDDDLEPIAERLAPETVFDMSQISRINSAGVRQWIRFVAKIRPGVRLVLEKCPLAVVNQINMIANFLGPAEVSSIYVPFICPSCYETFEQLVEIEAVKNGTRPSVPLCTACQEPMESDINEEDYFAFLKGK